MKTYMLLNGLRWSRNSGSILCNTLKKWCFRTAWGGVCYESYLTNVSLPAVIPAFSLFVGNVDIAFGGYLRYLLIVVIGILLSYYLNKVNKHLLSLIFVTSK